MQCPKHPNEVLIPIYGWLGGEQTLDQLICWECSKDEFKKPFRIPFSISGPKE
jgi:hypothetical protein